MPRKDKTQQYNYLIDYVKEAADSREPLRAIIDRVVLAYKQCPSHNSYKENANSYYQNIANTDPELGRCLKTLCDSIPESTNDTVFNAVETFVSMGMGGASQFEYQPADKYADKDADLIDRLSELAKYFHDENKIDALVPKAVRNLIMQGQANFYLCPTEEPGRFKVSLIDAYKMLHDPRASRTNTERYTGFTEVRSWNAVKDEIYRSGKDYKVKTINDVDQYIECLQGGFEETRWENELSTDLDTFKGIYHSYRSKNSISTNSKGDKVSPVEPGYKGDDVEVAYIWDLVSNIYAVIINRRFIVKAEENQAQKNVQVPYMTSDGTERTRSVKVALDSPIITIPFIEAGWETFPVSPLFYCLDDFDTICSIESVMMHDLSIMAPITFQGASFDAEQYAKLSQIAGQIVEGTLNTFGVMNKQHDISPCITAISRFEQRIKRMLGATDQFELQAMMGDRATAAEVSSNIGAVSQRMNAPLANIECGMSEMIQKMFAMTIIFTKDESVIFPYKGTVGTATKQDMLGRSLISAKLKSRIKIEQDQQGRNALMVLQTLIGIESVNKNALISTLVPIVTQGVVSRRQASSFLQQEQVDPLSILQAQQQVEQMQADSAQSMGMPITPEMIEGMSPEEIGQLSQSIGSAIAPQESAPMTTPMEPALAGIPNTGYDNYQAGIEANTPIEQTESIDQLVL